MLEERTIENMIYEIREKQVMLDIDLAIVKCHRSTSSCKSKNTSKRQLINLIYDYAFNGKRR